MCLSLIVACGGSGDSTTAPTGGNRNAATVSGGTTNAGTTTGIISINGFNDKQALLFTFAAPTAPGTYPLSYTSPYFLWAVDPAVTKPAGAQCCWGVTGDAGTISFTAVSKTRVKGTFTITLSPQPGTAAKSQLVIAGGAFDIGMFHTP